MAATHQDSQLLLALLNYHLRILREQWFGRRHHNHLLYSLVFLPGLIELILLESKGAHFSVDSMAQHDLHLTFFELRCIFSNVHVDHNVVSFVAAPQ